MLNRVEFYKLVKDTLFKGKILPTQLEGMNTILDEWEARGLEDKAQLAYMLATTFHETAFTMQPIKEWGRGKGKKYGFPDAETGHTYYGRGFVQLTWKYNYSRMSDVVSEDLVKYPDLALDPKIATKILFTGMELGLFTGKKLLDYINRSKSKKDYRNARRIINGLDKAELIAKYATRFENALNNKI